MSNQNYAKDLTGGNTRNVQDTWHHSLWSQQTLVTLEAGWAHMTHFLSLCWCAYETFCLKLLGTRQTYMFSPDYWKTGCTLRAFDNPGMWLFTPLKSSSLWLLWSPMQLVMDR